MFPIKHLEEMVVIQDMEPDFSNTRTLHFRELIDTTDMDEHSTRDDFFNSVYRVTTVKGYVLPIRKIKGVSLEIHL